MTKRLKDVAKLVSGSPQFRITESLDPSAPTYSFYDQADIADDLTGMQHSELSDALVNRKQVSTNDLVKTLSENDLIFSLISGDAAIVRRDHAGFLYTQNYVTITLRDGDNNTDDGTNNSSAENNPTQPIYRKFLVYLLNNDAGIKRQFQIGLQGSQVLKYTVKQLGDIELPKLPSSEVQRLVSNVYFDQLRLAALRHRVADTASILALETMKEVLN